MRFPRFISTEPALWIALIDAAIVAAVTFGAPVTPLEHGAIDAVLVAAGGVLIRSQVSPLAPAAPAPAAPPPARPLPPGGV